MTFLQKSNIKKTILVISDLHLGAGLIVNKRKNFLEDFHYDKELIEFIEYHGSMHYQEREVELIINGDFLDLLAVPFVPYFDDEFWSEQASLDKLKMIVNAHPGVFEALRNFLTFPNNRLVYIIGNHDAELIFESLRQYIVDQFPKEDQFKFKILLNTEDVYIPEEGVVLKHGHEYELAHHFDPITSIATDVEGKKYFIPPWGSYYVTRVINKFKESRDYINAVRPINKFMINGIIYDSLYTMRFAFANFYYFLMVRFVMIFKQNKKTLEVLELVKKEIQLFQNYEALTEEFVTGNADVHALIVGHTHDPIFREYDDGSIFINTGTWTKMYNLDFGKNFYGARLTFARVDVKEKSEEADGVVVEKFDHLDISLNEWRGKSDLPFKEFRF
ncbi:metallophosphoesterase [Bacteriovorax sp. PP10]|uniref:Metallophosphoesterase n=1 Tax=Bacteriovorax antarcticus TaxID=3088717 RepID=A0ABU5VY83_9BACT|nr:metallophosphoesterase [Bacteriovorax sp. PP10]MEA9358012.1 metallophosphoesterase [Bacteriovorax sp. PP10]